MKRLNYKLLIRKSHRYLGIFIGIQFLFWTLGGLYFSWTNLKEIHGDHLRKEKESFNFSTVNFISPATVTDEILKANSTAKIARIQTIELFGDPFYAVTFHSGKKHETILANAANGRIRPKISEDEARRIAGESLAEPRNIKQISYLTEENVNTHHEYREKPLPAWAVTFEDGLTVYIAAETGQIQAFRTNDWRVFDFLWMLHTMDFETRDNINNYLLRGFSILGIATILSGFLLFFVSSKFFRKLLFAKRAKSEN